MDNATDQVLVRREDIKRMYAMAEHWHDLGKCKFASAKNYPKGDFGRRFIEHGAWCYTNCALELSGEIRKMVGVDESRECADEANPSHIQT